MNQKKQNVSMSVIRRLPRYYRFLNELGKKGVTRVSSKELSEKMGFTASQIRQDFNCFGGFGQQGYGYNVSQLCGEIEKILGIQKRHPCILVGAGNLGKAIARHMPFEQLGWVKNDPDTYNLRDLDLTSDTKAVEDMKGNRLLLFTSDWAIRWAETHNEELKLSEFGNI